MTILIILLLTLISSPLSEKPLTFDFGNSADKTRDWVLITDNVMGGLSKSEIIYNANSILLKGDISLDNFGGFSSIRTKFSQLDLSQYEGVKIKFKSTKQHFAFTLENSQNWTRPNYKNNFHSNKDGTWMVATLYFKDFQENVIGQPTGKQLNLEKLKKIVRIGIITTKKEEGPFSLEVDYIRFF
jgi:NADH dehydrogenase [ubiquinone] 1 alpha subcomplex assembly factor 1